MNTPCPHVCPRCGTLLEEATAAGGGRGICPACAYEAAAADTLTAETPPPGEDDAALAYGMLVGPEGRFLLLDKLGEGGMGEVWLAQDRELSKEGEPVSVALKFLAPSFHRDPAALNLLRDEVVRSQRLNHPNIVRIFDLHTHQGVPFIKMEYVEGNSLRRWLSLEPSGVMPASLVAQIARQVAEALEYAHHQEGVVHRDLKPGNLLWKEDTGTVKLADFGIAVGLADLEHGRWQAGLGTLHYASPQQIAGQKPSPEDDIYALGATLYELLTGATPFEAETRESLIQMIRYHVPERIPDRLAALGRSNEVSSKLLRLVQLCLEKDPLKRPKALEITRLLATETVVQKPIPVKPPDNQRPPIEVVEPPTPEPRTAVWGRLTVLLLCLLAALGSTLLWPPARRWVIETIFGPPPELTLQPADLTLPAGSNGTLTVEARGTEPLQYRWRKDSENLVEGSGLAGADSSRLTFQAVSTNQAGAYSAVITDRVSRTVTSQVAVLSVNLPRIPEANDPPPPPAPQTGTLKIAIADPQHTSDPATLVWEAVPASGESRHGAIGSNGRAETELVPGHYTVTVRTTRSPVPWTLRTEADVALNDTANCTLAFVSGTLTVESSPPGADVSWAPESYRGESTGRSTPFTSDHFKSGLIPLRIEKRCYRTVQTNYAFDIVRQDQARTLSVPLRPERVPCAEENPVWTNSLKMVFRLLANRSGQACWACLTETTVGQFREFIEATRYEATDPFQMTNLRSLTATGFAQIGSWRNPWPLLPAEVFHQTDQHPVVGVNCQDARRFCEWLTDQERRLHERGETVPGLLRDQSYGLPTTEQWLWMTHDDLLPWRSGLSGMEETNPVPPWTGNYAGVEVDGRQWPTAWEPTVNFNDGFPRTAPVDCLKFKASPLGFRHVGGNVAEWCYDGGVGVAYGGSWRTRLFWGQPLGEQLNPPRDQDHPPLPDQDPNQRSDCNGFRVFLLESFTNPIHPKK